MASAHQFQIQEAMETGMLGLIGTLLLSIGIFLSLCRSLVRGARDELNDTRFMLLIGPASFVMYAIIANAALTNGSLNTWVVLAASMLALAPRFEAAPALRSLTSVVRPRTALQVGQASDVAQTC
jgi:O-antigen ligase